MERDPRRQPARLRNQTAEMWQSLAIMGGAVAIVIALLVLLIEVAL